MEAEYIVIGINYIMKQIPPSLNALSVGKSIVSKGKFAWNIGVIMDQTLSIEQQINNICYLCCLSIRNISHKTIFNRREETLNQLLFEYITSKLDYHNALL